MAISSADHDPFLDGLWRCAEKLKSENNSAPHPALSECLTRSNGGAFSTDLRSRKKVMHLHCRMKMSPRQGEIGKQQRGITRQQNRRSSKGNIKMLPANESNFKALVFEHTCKPSSPAVMQSTSPPTSQSNSSVLAWGSRESMSLPGSPISHFDLKSRMGFCSQPTSPLSPCTSSPFCLSPEAVEKFLMQDDCP